MADLEGLYFTIGIDTSGVEQGAEEMKSIIAQIGAKALEEGKNIDKAFADIGKNFDTSSLEKRLEALKTVIADNEAASDGLTNRIAELGEKAKAALADDDMPAFRNLTEDMNKCHQRLVDLNAETEIYRRTLNAIEQAAGIQKQADEADRLSQEIVHVADRMAAMVAAAETSGGSGAAAAVKQTAAYKELEKQLEAMHGRLVEIEAENSKVDEVIGELSTSMQGLAGIMATFKGVSAFVGGKDSKELQELQTQIQGLIGIMMSLRRSMAAIKNSGFGEALAKYRAQMREYANSASVATVANGGMSFSFKNLALSVRTFWTALKTAMGPIGWITAAVGVLTVAVTALIKKIKEGKDAVEKLGRAETDTANRQAHLNETAELKNKEYDERIKQAEHELAMAKTRHASETEIYKLEQKISGLKSEKANWNTGYRGISDEEYKKVTEEAKKYADILDQLNEAKERGDKKVKVDIDLDGKLDKVDVDKAIEKVQEALNNRKATIDLELQLRGDKRQAEEEAAEQQKKQIDAAKAAARTERDILKAEKDNELSLMADGYAKEAAMRNAQYDKAIDDLKYRLKTEENLTAKARASLKKQIEQQEAMRRQANEKAMAEHQEAMRQLDMELAEAQLQSSSASDYQKKVGAARIKYDNTEDSLKQQRDSGKITPEEYAKRIAIAQANLQAAEKQAYKGLIAEYQTFEQRRLELAEEYAVKRQDLVTVGANEGMLAKLDEQFQASMQSLNGEEFEASLGGLTKEALQELLDEAIAVLDALEATGTATAGELAKAKDRISAIQGTMSKAGMEPDKKSKKEWKEWLGVVAQGAEVMHDLGDAVGGTAGEIISGVGDIISTTVTAIQDIDDVVKTSTDGVKGVSQLATAELSAMESASVILTIISAAIQVIKTVHNLIQSGQEKRAAEATAKWQAKVDALTKAYDKLGRAIEKAYSFEKKEMIQQQRANLEEQRRLQEEEYERWAKEYRRLAGLNAGWDIFVDDSKVEDAKGKRDAALAAMDDLDEQIADLEDSMVEAIYGHDVQAAIEDFADALASAWEDGTDAAEVSANFVKKLMKNMIVESVKQMISQSNVMKNVMGLLEAYFTKMQGTVSGGILPQALFGEGVGSRKINPVEYAENELTRLQQTITDVYGGLINSLYEGDSDREAASKGIATASQDSIDELNGRMTAVQGHTFNINENSNIIRDNVAAIHSSVLAIEGHTQHLVRMDNDMHSMQATVSEIYSSINR